MIILVKTSTITFSLDIDLNDRVSSLIKKVQDRSNFESYQFQLSYCGRLMSDPDEPLSEYSIKKESTIHMNVIQNLTYDVEYDSIIYKVSIPNNTNLNVRHLSHMFISTISTVEPNARLKIIKLRQGNNILNDSLHLQTNVSLLETIYATLEDKPVSETTGIIANNDQPEQFSNDDVLKHFIGSTLSNDIEIVFCFDTTGSMHSIITEVRTKLRETVTRLIKEIPSIKIGIVGIGDYCDHFNVISSLELTSNVDRLCKFIMDLPNTNGGDEPEAYELALNKVKFMSWSKHTSKAVVVIGDSPPHPPTYTNQKINWVQEVDDLGAMGIKIYGVVCQHISYKFFYQTMAERTGGLSIKFDRFNLITDMFLAICFRESSKEKYQQFKNERVENGGASDSAMCAMFSDLDKDNYKVDDMYEKELSIPNSSTTTTTTTTTLEEEEVNNNDKNEDSKLVIKKRYGVLDLEDNNSNKNNDYVSFLNKTDEDNGKVQTTFKITFGGFPIGKMNSASTFKHPVIGVVLGSFGIGFRSFSKALILERLRKKGKLIFHDYRMDSLAKLPMKPIFVVAFSHGSVESFDALSEKIEHVRTLHETIPIVLMGLKSDLKTKESSSLEHRLRSLSISSKTTIKDVVSQRPITKSQRDSLIQKYNLLGEIECSINNKSSLKRSEKDLYKIYKSSKLNL